MRAEKGFSNLALAFVAVLLLGSVAFTGISPINLNAAAPPASDERAQNISPFISFGGGGDAEYLIITRQMFESALQPLVDLKKQRMSVKVITLEEIIEKVRFYSTSSDGEMIHLGEVYAEVHDATTADHISDSFTTVTVGQSYVADKYVIFRDVLYFETSSLPDDAKIISATLSLYGYGDSSVTDFDIVVQNGQPTYPHDPVVAEDYDLTHYSDNGGSFHTSNFITTDYNDITLNSTGISWIKKDDVTKLCLRSSMDIDTIAPTGYEDVIFFTSEKGTGYQPYLEVTYGCYPGRDIPEQIRNCIRDHYENHGTKWVLLAGDADHDGRILENGAWNINYILDKDWEVPPRYVLEPPKPSDYYYAGLDGTWDNDGDNIFGELGEVDWGANVYVGRIPARDASTMQVVVDKTVAYELNPSRKIKDVCFFSAPWSEDIKRGIKEEIIPSEVSVHEFYESDGNLDGNSFENAINNYNPVLVNAAGHGIPSEIQLAGGGNFVNTNTPTALKNKGFLMFALSCMTNLFDSSDNCLGEAMLYGPYLSDPPYGAAVGYVGFVDEAFGNVIDEAFFREIFWNQEYHQGAILYKANERASSSDSLKCVLLGDPELKIVEPVSVSISPEHGSGLPGATLTYTVTVRNMSNREETYDLTATDTAGWWNLMISPNTLTVPADENRTATLSITVSPYASIGDEDKITVTATSTENAEASDSASCIAHAGLRMVIYPSADVCAFVVDPEMYYRTQLKFDIRSTPGVGVVSAKLWLYRCGNSGGDWDGGVTVNRVDNQTWDESITAGQFNAQPLTDQQNHGGKWMSNGWDFLAVLDQLKVDRNASRENTSLRLRWADDDGTQPITGCHDVPWLDIGSSYENEPSINFYSSEYSDPAYRPYLEIIYGPVAPFELATLYKVRLNMDLELDEGSKLVLKFYTWGGAFQAENVVWSGTTPCNVVLSKDVEHPLGKVVEKAELDLTIDNTENVIATIDTLVVTKTHIEMRFMEIPMEWVFAYPPAYKIQLEMEFMAISLQWALAPS